MRSPVIFILAVLALINVSRAFKENEFKVKTHYQLTLNHHDMMITAQKCAGTGFCRRHRGLQGPKFDVLGDSIKIDGHALSASLRNQRDNVDLLLSLKAYSDGFVRLVRKG